MSTEGAAHETVVEGPGEVEVEVEVEVEGWRAEVQRRLDELGRDVWGLDPSGRTLTELRDEVTELACVVAWFEEGGNITTASKRRGTSRRVLRDRVNVWRERCPQLFPHPPPRPVLTEEEAAEARRVRQNKRNVAKKRAEIAKKRAEIAKKREKALAGRWARAGTVPKPEGGQ